MPKPPAGSELQGVEAEQLQGECLPQGEQFPQGEQAPLVGVQGRWWR